MINKKIDVPSNWEKIEHNDLSKYNVASLPEAKVLSCYKIGSLYDHVNTMVLYDYGEDVDLINELESSYKQLQLNLAHQDKVGFFPIYWERFNNDCFLSIIKSVNSPLVNLVDIFFSKDNHLYCCHTNINKEERNFELSHLCEKYKDIGFVVNEITSKN